MERQYNCLNPLTYRAMSRSILIHFLLCGFLALASPLDSASADPSTEKLQRLFEAIGRPEKAASLTPSYLSDFAESLTEKSSMWPLRSFLLAEVYRLRGDVDRAHPAYRSLAEWAASNPYGDGWGGSGLATVALWRWLAYLDGEPAPDAKEARHVIQIAAELTQTKLARGMFESLVLESLLQLEEDIARRQASLAWKVGDKSKALRLFFDYLKITSNWDLRPIERKMMEEVVARGLASPERLKLFRGKRLLALKRYDDARVMLNDALDSDDVDVSSEAGLYLARLKSIRLMSIGPENRQEIVKLLDTVVDTAVDSDVIQNALLERAKVHNRMGQGRNVGEFRTSLLRLIKDFPHGRLVNNALFLLAANYQTEGNDEQALQYFERLRHIKSPSKRYKNLSYYRPALMLYTRAQPRDTAEASTILQEMEKERPLGDLHLHGLFWLGRIAEESGRKEEADTYFKRVIRDKPYDYYAIRARMHVNIGENAKMQILPDDATKDELHRDYQKSKNSIEQSLTKGSSNSPYHLRVGRVVEAGVYSKALAEQRRFRNQFPSQRLEDCSLAQLDSTHLLGPMSVLLSVRQDAIAAADAPLTPANRLQVAATVGQDAKDWPLAMSLLFTGIRFDPNQAALQKDERYLATAYPVVFPDLITKYSARYGVKAELLYSIMRQESLFSPTALSSHRALGLFQFTPRTFNSLNTKWNLLNAGDARSMEEFLMNPDLSIQLGARWVGRELLPHHNGNILFAVFEHISGPGAVKQWKKGWHEDGRSNDVEYMVETAGHFSARQFAREVLTDVAISESAAILKPSK